MHGGASPSCHGATAAVRRSQGVAGLLDLAAIAVERRPLRSRNAVRGRPYDPRTVATAVSIFGLGVTVAAALVLAWADLTATTPTWDSLVSDWRRRRRYALIGFPAIAVATALQILALAID